MEGACKSLLIKSKLTKRLFPEKIRGRKKRKRVERRIF
jgi:hypothetical protein